MMGTVTEGSAFAIDVVLFCERLAERLQRAGYAHPVAAAVAQAARGHHGMDIEAFAAHLGLPPVDVRAAERGEVAFADLPDAVTSAFGAGELLSLAELDGRAGPTH